MIEFGSIINGKQVKSGEWIDIYNPFTKKQVGRVSSIDTKTLDKVLTDTKNTKMTLTRYERYDILNKIANALEERVDEVSKMITDETGLCLKDTRYEASRVSDVLRFSAMKALDDDSQVFPCDVSKNGKPRRIYTTRVPLGLISCITPFNHPMNQVVHKIAPAIATNNTVVLKPSEKTPLSAYYFAQLALDCGLPPNMLNVINGADVQATAEMMTIHPEITMVSFTGGSKVGKIIASKAGYKKLVLELGGSSALLILEDADIDEAVEVTMSGTFKNSAQRCTAIRRILVHESIADTYAAKLATRVKALKYGDPYNAENDMGTVITEESAMEMEARVQNAIDNGAVLLAGHKRDGALYAPTVLDHVQNAHEVVAKETFGPVAPIIRFTTLDEAIDIANDTPYGLSGGVVSNHWPSIQRVITELDTGTVNVNEAPSYRLEWTPFGGVKDSGLGYKEGVIETMKGYTYVKTYSLPWDIA
ncbi:aldehyde dehydrogenase family protein [Arenibacter sp. S6351L]|uniref:aldehyde dehydrogenase family protein n=1 Tax=Arenibacter sp. S6351L TaxID=2926407 RepID=UPI001FF3BDFB|nr:aldehyde dehydrogenase family protein [Arenibacter sp. S6351L]MCK0133910.1 aldehyde dehydrogenase family protein [Arenibacter sp. S6351L]